MLYTANPDFVCSIQEMSNDISALSSWCEVNCIRINTDNTKMMLFGNSKNLEKLPAVDVQVDGSQVAMVSSYKYLGVELDSQLNYNKHVRKILNGASIKLKQLRRMRSFLNIKSATLVYKNMILPIIEYGDIFLVGATARNRKQLQVLQNKGLRCALNKDIETDTDELHADAKLLKLKFRREQHLLNYMFDMSKQKVNVKEKRKVGAFTRSQKGKLLRVKRPRTEKFKKSLRYRGPKKWNNLPSEVQQKVSRSEFKCKIHELVVQKASIGMCSQLVS